MGIYDTQLQVINDYKNQASQMLFRFQSDIQYDIDAIKRLKVGEVIFFIITSTGTHQAHSNNYQKQRQTIERVWGNYCTIAVKRFTEDGYGLANYDKCMKYSFGNNEPQQVIDAMNEFEVNVK